MTTLLALWICSLCFGAVYYSLPQEGMRLDIYSIGLWVLSSGVFVGSAMILVSQFTGASPCWLMRRKLPANQDLTAQLPSRHAGFRIEFGFRDAEPCRHFEVHGRFSAGRDVQRAGTAA